MRGLQLLLVATILGSSNAINNGYGLLPPMGWRSWNCYHADVNQTLMESIMDRMAERVHKVDDKPTSLADLGYLAVGLDDNWQKCGAGVDGSFHDKDGNPIINTDTFPDMKKMTDHAHSLGLRAGWYMNNCICSEHEFKDPAAIAAHMQRSAQAVADFGFDGVKLDGCGEFRNLTWWAQLLNATGRPIMIENCHWGGTVPGQTTGDAPCDGTETPSDCPYNFFRTSGDITNTWGSMFKNLQTTTAYQGEPPLARPGTWAYPDMLEVGRMASYEEDRTHFAAWAITSSPLILGYDLNDDNITSRVWDIIANVETLQISQTWAGHPGRLAKQWQPSSPTPPGNSTRYLWGVSCDKTSPEQVGWKLNTDSQLTIDNLCVAPAQSSDSLLLDLVACDATDKTQKFTFDGTIKHTETGKCVDVYDFKGPVVQLYACNGGKNQAFKLDGTMVTAASGSDPVLVEGRGEP